MLIIHDGEGLITSLQLFPETSELPHIVVDDDLFHQLEPFLTAGLQLDHDGEVFILPLDIADRSETLALESLRAEKLKYIERSQFDALQAGVPFDFGGAPDIVQTRSERDLINISGITMRGLLLRSDAVNDAVIEFRAQSNTSYMITGQQAIDLGATVAQYNEQIYSKAWMLKDALTTAKTIAEVEAVEW